MLLEKDSTEIWYPASLTKLMTVYVALDAVRAGRLTMDTPLVVSARAASQAPSKMGFRPGTEVTLDNALKMLMVKSPNDIAVTVAEGVSGSVEAFAAEMNAEAQKIGLHESQFVNPNGLHNPEHYTSARDMAMIARALLRDFPERAGLFDIGELQLGSQIIRNHNGLLGRYPGADGMKTGFTCPAGFNVVATANHYGRRLITVVLGMPTGQAAQPGGGRSVRSRLRHGQRVGLPGFAALRRRRAAQYARQRLPASQRRSGRRGGGGGRGGGDDLTLGRPGRRRNRGGGGVRRPDPHRAFRRAAGVRPGACVHRTGRRLERPGSRAPQTAAVAEAPSAAKAYAGAEPDAIANASATGGPNAPQALQGAVRTPPAEHRHHLKPAKRSATAKASREDGAEDGSRESRSGHAAAKAAGRPVIAPSGGRQNRGGAIE